VARVSTTPTAARAPLTRERIRDAARAQVEAVGLDGLSLREVARSLGVSAAALYAHVDGKQGLVAAVAEDAFEGLSERFAALDVADPIERIRAQSHAYVAYALASPHLYPVMMAFEPELPGAPVGATRRGLRSDRATAVFEEAMSAVTESIAQGRIRFDDPTLVALILWSSVHGLVGTLSMGFDLPEPVRTALVDAAIETTLRGLAADPGPA
jgi:AcrR family transcriptional regulator